MKFHLIFFTLIFILFFAGCEKEVNNDCMGCASNSKEISAYKSIETYLLTSKSKAYSKIDSIVDTVKKSEDFLRFDIAFMDSLISREAVTQVAPFYLRINALNATPPAIIYQFRKILLIQ